MLYVDAVITFAEVPDEISLCISISGCPNHCPACHSKYLWDYVGDVLDEETLMKLITENDGITCVSIMGGDAQPDKVFSLLSFVKKHTSLKTCWYSGRTREWWENANMFPKNYSCLDYVKFGPYDENCGSLDKKTTNQRFYKVEYDADGNVVLNDMTYKFWRN